jgi:hypothetical protein
MKAAKLATTSQETARRLRLLADYLEVRVSAERLNQRVFADEGVIVSGRLDPDPLCETSACAGGWATTIPEFQRAGLHLRRLYMCTTFTTICVRGMSDVLGIDALEIFFGLTAADANGLFGPQPAIPREKARQLRKVAARYERKIGTP